MIEYDDVRNQVSLEDALELLELDPPHRWPGHIHCPVHEEDTPSCWVTDDHFYCFGCGENGDVLRFVSLHTGMSLPQVAQWLSGTFDWSSSTTVVQRSEARPPADLTEDLLRLTKAQRLEDYEMAAEYVSRRWPHLDLPWLERVWGVRVGEWNLLIPHWVPDDFCYRRVAGIKRRTLPAGNKRSVDGSQYTWSLYHAPVTDGTTVSCVLVEGESDCWTLQRHYGDRVQVYALPSGAQLWRPVFAEQLRRHELIWMMPDTDVAGEEAWQKVTAAVPEVARMRIPLGYKDVTEAYLGGWRPPLV